MSGDTRNKRRQNKVRGQDSLPSKVQHLEESACHQDGSAVSSIEHNGIGKSLSVSSHDLKDCEVLNDHEFTSGLGLNDMPTPTDTLESQQLSKSESESFDQITVTQRTERCIAGVKVTGTLIPSRMKSSTKSRKSFNNKPASILLPTSEAVELCVSKVGESKSDQPTARLGRSFFDVPGEELAKALLGQKIVRIVEGVRLCAKIVETEAYLGAIDKAAHSYKRQTSRNKAMFMEPGTAYVYNIYGMYCCLNISSQGEGCAVLIRSVEALEGIEKMMELRRGKMKSTSSKNNMALKIRELGNGPSKLCQSLGITKAVLNQRYLVTDTETWLEAGFPVARDSRVVSQRINIAYAEEWTDKPLRFYMLGNPCVSVRDKQAEQKMELSSQYFSK